MSKVISEFSVWVVFWISAQHIGGYLSYWHYMIYVLARFTGETILLKPEQPELMLCA